MTCLTVDNKTKKLKNSPSHRSKTRDCSQLKIESSKIPPGLDLESGTVLRVKLHLFSDKGDASQHF